jgi:hypothetical protein
VPGQPMQLTLCRWLNVLEVSPNAALPYETWTPQSDSKPPGSSASVYSGEFCGERPHAVTRRPQAAYSPGFPPSVAGEIRAGTKALAVELDKPGVIIENWLPGPTLAGDGQFADELSSMLSSSGGARAEVG